MKLFTFELGLLYGIQAMIGRTKNSISNQIKTSSRAGLPEFLQILIIALITIVLITMVGLWFYRTDFPLLIDDVASLSSVCQYDLRNIQYGPFYAIFYCGLNKLLPDLIITFYVKQTLVALVVVFLLYQLGRSFAIEPVLMGCTSLWVAIVSLGFNGTSLFSLLLAIAGCLVAARSKRFGWIGFFIFLGIAFFVRTEYLLAIMLGTLLLILKAYVLWKKSGVVPKQSTIQSLFVGITVVTLCTILYVLTPTPSDGDRTWVAFGQHFAVNYTSMTGVGGDPMVDWEQIVAGVFHTSHSIGNAIRENPRMVIWHGGYNLIQHLPNALRQLLVIHTGFLSADAVIAGILFISILGIGTMSIWNEEQWIPILSLVIVPVPSIAIMPKAIYLQPLIPLVAILSVKGLRTCMKQTSTGMKVVPILLGLVLTFGTLGTFVNLLQPSPSDRIPSVLLIVKTIRQEAHPDRPVRLLASFYGWRICKLASPNFCEPVDFAIPGQLQPNEKLSSYAQRQQVNMILVDSSWSGLSAVQSDPIFAEFVTQPNKFGCVADQPTKGGFQLYRCSPTFIVSEQS